MDIAGSVATLAGSIVGAVAGAAWLVWLRSNASSWNAGLGQHLIQTFNACLLIGPGLAIGLTAVSDLNPDLLSETAAFRIGIAMTVAMEGCVMVVARRQPRTP